MLRVLTLSTLFPDATRPNFGIFVERQTLGLAALPGVEVRVVAPIGVPPGPLALIRHSALRAVPDHEIWHGLDVARPRFAVLPGTRGRWHAASLRRALIPMLDDLRRSFLFDVIDASFFFPDGPAAIALGQRYGVPVSIKARGADIHHWGNAPATAAQVRAAGVAADGLLAVSHAMRDDMIALGMPAERIAVHHTGVDLARFRIIDRAAAKAALEVSGPLVASVGALIPRKRHEMVIEAVAALPDVTLFIAGEGPERPRLLARAAALGIAERVRLLGSVPHAQLPHWLGAADVMALASSSEGLANAWLEALACGTPIVITPAGGAEEVVRTAETGRIAQGNSRDFARAIVDMLAAPPSPHAVRAAVQAFTWEANSAALVDHLRTLAGERPRQASSG